MTRCSRRIYLGNLPIGVGLSDQILTDYMNATLPTLGILTERPVICSSTKPDIKYGFIELRAVGDVELCLSLLNGHPFANNTLKTAKPKDHIEPHKELLEYVVPLELAAHGPTPAAVAPGVQTVINLVQSQIANGTFAGVRPGGSGGSSEARPVPAPAPAPANSAASSAALLALLGGGAGLLGLENTSSSSSSSSAAVSATALGISSTPTKIMLLQNMVSSDELFNEDDYNDIVLVSFLNYISQSFSLSI